jgi:hypothetical protein
MACEKWRDCGKCNEESDIYGSLFNTWPMRNGGMVDNVIKNEIFIAVCLTHGL